VAVEQLQEQFDVSERRACTVLDQPRGSQRYEAKPRDDEAALAKRMRALVRQRPRFGYRRIGALLRAEAWHASDTRVYRLWRREGLKVPRKRRKRRSLGMSANSCQQRRAEHQDHVWCWDFVFDRTVSGSNPALDEAIGDRNALHRAGQSLGERLCRELPQPAV
jgi:putative transposase